jgi:hypothetical protein
MVDAPAPATDPADLPRLRLAARDVDDLTVVSAALQDAIVSVGDMAYLSQDGLFVLVGNRFRWEDSPSGVAADAPDGEGEPVYHRVLSGVQFRGVRRVAARKLDLKDRGRWLNLLAIEAAGGAAGAVLTMTFAGGAQLRLEAEGIDVALEDRGQPWPTTRRPRHEIEDGAETD